MSQQVTSSNQEPEEDWFKVNPEIEKTALVEMPVCRFDIALTKREAKLWQIESGIEPSYNTIVTKYLYCYPVSVAHLQLYDWQNNVQPKMGEGIKIGSKVVNCEPQCPMDGCTARYDHAVGIVKAIFPTSDLAIDAMYGEAILADPKVRKTKYWFTNIYQ